MQRRVLTMVLCGMAASAHADPVYTLIEDGREAGSRWLNQIGAGGHVVYFQGNELRRWNGASTEVLHTIGTHLDGLLPQASTTTFMGIGSTPFGHIFGVDRDGGASVLLEGHRPGGDPLSRSKLIASTTTAGGFRAVMASPLLSDDPSVVPAAAVSHPALGMRRSSGGHTLARGFWDDSRSVWSVSPELEAASIFTAGQIIPGTQDVGLLSDSYTITPGGGPYGTAMYSDISSSGSTAQYFIYDTGQTTQFSGLLRAHNGTTEVIASSALTINGLRIFPGHIPKVRINASGRVLAAGTFMIDGQYVQNAMVLIDPDGQSSEFIVNNGALLPMTNYQNVLFGMPSNIGLGLGAFHYNDDGAMMTEVTGSGGPSVIHRSPNGQFNMVLTGDADFLGVSGSIVLGLPQTLLMSTDATSAAGVFNVDHRKILFHAFADGSLTRLLGVSDAFTVAPGDVRTIADINLIDVNGPHVLFAVRFDDLSSGMFSVTVPNCRADLNNDGVVDADDFFLFLNFFAAGDPRADINGDGVIDTDDFFDYLDLFAQGC